MAPRGAVFVVPRADLSVFALGILPRDAEVRRALERLADLEVDTRGGGTLAEETAALRAIAAIAT